MLSFDDLLFNLQKAILSAIKVTEIKETAGIYDYVPENVPFPFIVLGDDKADAMDTKTALGFETTSLIHVWGKGRSMKTVKTLIGKLVRLLSKDIGDFEFYKVSMMSVNRETIELIKSTIEVKYRISED